MLAALLKEPDTEVHVLVRAQSAVEAASRLRHTLKALDLRPEEDRLRPLLGDTEQPSLGMSASDSDMLLSSCSHVIHCAGAVKMNLPIEAARRSAVGAASHVLELARKLAARGRLAKIDVVSTVGVAGRVPGVLREAWVGVDHGFHNTYEQAKAEAEQLLRLAVQEGLPLTVHRPSMVVGDSRTGRAVHFQVFYYLAEFLSGRRTRGFFPELGNARLDVIPADVAARAIVFSSKKAETVGRILHLCAGAAGALPLLELQAIIRQALSSRGRHAPKARYIPRAAFRAALAALRIVADAKGRSALDTLPIFLDYLDTDQTFDNVATRHWLGQHRLPIPEARDYLPTVLDFYYSSQEERQKVAAKGSMQYRRS